MARWLKFLDQLLEGQICMGIGAQGDGTHPRISSRNVMLPERSVRSTKVLRKQPITLRSPRDFD